MANQGALAAVSRTLQTLLLDRMVTTPLHVTLTPPDTTFQNEGSARVNLYLMQVIENAELKNQEIPFVGSPGAYGRPPLSLNLRYLMTTYSAQETEFADLNAQGVLGDAMRVLHDFGNRIDSLAVTKSAAGTQGDPILDVDLTNEFERLRITLHPATLDDYTKIWSAFTDTSFRRSVIYEVTVVQIETQQPRTLPQPVERRRILATVRSRPVITAVYVTPLPSQPEGELRVRIGESITIEATDIVVDRLYVRLGSLDPLRVTPNGGRVTITLPDDTYPIDLDNPLTRPIPVSQQLQPGPLTVQLIAHQVDEGVEGGLDQGTAVTSVRRHLSNVALLQLVPRVNAVTPTHGGHGVLLTISGVRLWHAAAHEAEAVIGDAGVLIREPGPGDPWAIPTPTVVQIPVAEAAATLPSLTTPYPVAVQIDGARSRDAIGFTLEP